MRLSILTPLILFLLTTLAPASDDLGAEGNAILKPIVRVRTAYAGGSGTVIYSADRENAGEYRTFVLTNWHVISDAVHIVRKWDSTAGKYSHEEENDRVQVELFMYLRDGRTVIAQPISAEIVTHEEEEDLALLELDYPLQVSDVAELWPADKKLTLLQEVVAVGCSLGSDPIATKGHINDLEDIIDRRPYIEATADVIWGNSGGAVFTQLCSTWYFIGVPSRVTLAAGSAVTYMGYFIPPDRIRSWFVKQDLQFLVDQHATPAQYYDRRTAKRESRDKDGSS